MRIGRNPSLSKRDLDWPCSKMAATLSVVVAAASGALACQESSPRQVSGGDAVSSAAVLPEAAPSATADAVAGASTAWDAGPPVLAEGGIDGAALRKRHKARLGTDRSPVVLLAGGSALELGKRICEAAAPKRPPATPVLLKPNLCGFHAINRSNPSDNGITGRTTDPEFVRGVIQCLKARGHTKITIAEGCAIGHEQFAEVAKLTGYRQMADEENVPLVAMDDDGKHDVEGDQPGKPVAITGIGDTQVATLLLPKILAEHLNGGMWLSLPKIKAHRFSVVSLGIKGMQGVVMRSDASPAHAQKWRTHRELMAYMKTKDTAEDRALFVKSLETFSERMADVLEIAMPDAVLAEGAPAMGGDGFDVMKPLEGSYAIGGTNPIAVDKVGAELLGLWESDKLALGLRGHRTSPLIEVAAKRYGVDLTAVQVIGDGASKLREPRPTHFTSLAPFSVVERP
jgi:uncharacterized protein (DUF362 family)